MTDASSSAAPAPLHLDAHRRLCWRDAQGQLHTDVSVVRAFPISAPDGGVAILSAQGHELAWLDDLSALPASQRDWIQQLLAVREFAPRISRIDGVSTFATPSQWTVETDRGRTVMVLKSEEDIRRLDAERLLITDAHGMHFRIDSTSQLDAHSRKILSRFL